MESSKRAVEAYKRTRLIDHVVTDDDRVAPVYRLDEICDMLRTSSSDMVREMVEYTMKRLDSRSPRVKQKTLRMIKYVVGKGGPEFKRQMQRQSAVVRQLFEYKGQPDALRGDALNKAVRDTAHEAISAIFATEDKLPQTEEVNKRIMGFGSTNYEMPVATNGKKPLTNVVSDVIEFGSASIKQGLTMISGYSGGNIGNMKNDVGSYRGPSLRKSLTSERETFDRFERDERRDLRAASEVSGASAGPSAYNSRVSQLESSITRARAEADNGQGGTSQEERILDTITAPGGMRLQPTRESLQKFLVNVVKLDPKNLCYALESKLRSHAWQVRFKTLCVLEALVRHHDHDFFGTIVEFFEEDAGAIHDCLQSPQTSIRDKAVKILDHLGGSQKDSYEKEPEGSAEPKAAPQPGVVHDMPDLIDTGESDLLADEESVPHVSTSTSGDIISNLSVPAGDLLGEDLWAGDAEASAGTGSDDVFAGLSSHTSDSAANESTVDLFSGLSIGNKSSADGGFDLLLNGLHDEKDEPTIVNPRASSDSLADLMGSAALKDSGNDGLLNGLVENGGTFLKSSSVQGPHHSNAISSQMFGSLLHPQMTHLNSSVMLPMGMIGGYQAPIMMPQNFGTGVPANAFFQQQLLQRLSMGMSMMNGGNLQGATGSGRALVDSFDFSGDATSKFSSATDFAKKEDTKAFDFISDHVSAARGPKNFS